MGPGGRCFIFSFFFFYRINGGQGVCNGGQEVFDGRRCSTAGRRTSSATAGGGETEAAAPGAAGSGAAPGYDQGLAAWRRRASLTAAWAPHGRRRCCPSGGLTRGRTALLRRGDCSACAMAGACRPAAARVARTLARSDGLLALLATEEIASQCSAGAAEQQRADPASMLWEPKRAHGRLPSFLLSAGFPTLPSTFHSPKHLLMISTVLLGRPAGQACGRLSKATRAGCLHPVAGS